jgi:hypothetical protein
MYYSGCYLDRYPTAASASGQATQNPASASCCPRSLLAPPQHTLTPVCSQTWTPKSASAQIPRNKLLALLSWQFITPPKAWLSTHALLLSSACTHRISSVCIPHLPKQFGPSGLSPPHWCWQSIYSWSENHWLRPIPPQTYFKNSAVPLLAINLLLKREPLATAPSSSNLLQLMVLLWNQSKQVQIDSPILLTTFRWGCWSQHSLSVILNQNTHASRTVQDL